MLRQHGLLLVVFLVFLTHTATAQIMSLPASGSGEGPSQGLVSLGLIYPEQMTNNLWAISGQQSGHSPLDSLSGSVSKLDLKAPGKARREFAKGYQLLMRKDFKTAIGHLAIATSLYPEFVAAHNALGSAYLDLHQYDQAREQFAKAVSLDDHLPTSYLNLGCVQLALQDYRAAEESVERASSIAPVDLQLATALAYAQFMNHDYGAVVATAHQVHSRKHEGAAMVHYFAAAAWDAQNRPQDAQRELQILLQEDPKSPAAGQARNVLAQIKAAQIPAAPAEQLQIEAQDSREQLQIAGPESVCATCNASPSPSGAVPAGSPAISAASALSSRTNNPFTLRSVVDEVAVFFAATDHGKSVTDLTREEVGIRDDQKSPAAVTGFLNQAQLPLRLGIVIDTSESIVNQFPFEQRAAADFLRKALTNKNDLAFVVGVANSVLLVQDYTSDQQRLSHAVNQLAPGGGTALWDAVAFAADKLAARQEAQPVARMLVVISDGNDNSSGMSLKEAIASAERNEVCVYTVSTRDATGGGHYALVADPSLIGDRDLKMLADNTGGAAFVPGSIGDLDKGLDQLRQVIRSRYLISYKPPLFKPDGHYRVIDISARKSGRKLRVYARRGYYADANPRDETNP